MSTRRRTLGLTPNPTSDYEYEIKWIDIPTSKHETGTTYGADALQAMARWETVCNHNNTREIISITRKTPLQTWSVPFEVTVRGQIRVMGRSATEARNVAKTALAPEHKLSPYSSFLDLNGFDSADLTIYGGQITEVTGTGESVFVGAAEDCEPTI